METLFLSVTTFDAQEIPSLQPENEQTLEDVEPNYNFKIRNKTKLTLLKHSTSHLKAQHVTVVQKPFSSIIYNVSQIARLAFTS